MSISEEIIDGHDDSGLSPPSKEHELIACFLRPKIAGEPLPPFAAFIHDADVCSAPPAELTAAHEPAPTSPGDRTYWYFFSPMHCHGRARNGPRYRVGNGGLWVPCMRVKVKADGDGGAAVGYKRCFHYTELAAPVPRKKEWRMVEYMVPEEEEAADGEQQLALCVVSRRRAPPPSLP
ncbi:unnamed protein product [Urochloa humidicola]